jgi:hypothetical protein
MKFFGYLDDFIRFNWYYANNDLIGFTIITICYVIILYGLVYFMEMYMPRSYK